MRFVGCLFVIAFIVSPASARPFSIDDAMAIRIASTPRISPDGAQIAFVVERNDIESDKKVTEIHVASRDGTEIRRMTSGAYSASDPQWRPDRGFLSFIATRDDLDEHATAQVYTLDPKGGEPAPYTAVPQGVEGHQWSPDGRRLLLIIRDETDAAREARFARASGAKEKARPLVIDRLQFKADGVGYLDRSRAHLYVLDDRLGEPRQITFGDFEDSEPSWRPDGAEIAFVSNRTKEPDANDNTDLWLVSANPAAKRRALRRLTTNEGPDRAPAWSPDGKRVAYVSSVEPQLIWYATSHLALVDANGGEARLITPTLDRNIDAPRFSPDGDKVIATIEDNAEQKLAAIDPVTGAAESLIAGADTVFEFDLHPSGLIAAPVSRPDLPSEIFLFDAGALTQVTRLNEEALAGVEFTAAENVVFKSADGTEVQGFIYPAWGKRKKAPGFLFIHGGPNGQYDHSFDPAAQLFAANGYAVIMPNPRGSSGWGQAFSAAIFADWGNKDYEDVMAAVDDAVARGFADEKRLVVGGWSYGGILTNYVITKTQRFRAAYSGAGSSLYPGNYGHDIYQRAWEIELGLPWEAHETWNGLSPFYDIARVTTPTLVIGGAEDWNIPILNSEQLYQALKRLGVDTSLVVYPDEDHSIDRPGFVRDRYQRYLDWFARHLR